jgi:Flp pilus assembly pilin Flp
LTKPSHGLHVKKRLKTIFSAEEDAQAMVEYALILSLVTLFVLGSLQLTAGTILNLVDYVSSAITGAG